MSLRLQLLAFGLLTLALPWAGMRFVQEMEAALRSGLESSLRASAATVAAALATPLARDSAGEALARPADRRGQTIYAESLAADPEIDGRRDDWRLGDLPGLALDAAHHVWAGASERFAYLYVEADDEDLVYQSSPGRTPHGDRIVLLLEPRGGPPQWLVLVTGAPGVFRAQLTEPGAFAATGRFEERVIGAWRESGRGFAVEARVPLALVEAGLGIAFVDVDAAASGYAVATIASWDVSGPDAGAFVYRRRALEATVAGLTRAGDRFRVVDAAGWIVADTGGVAALAGGGQTAGASLAESFFRYALRREDPLYETLEAPRGRLADAALRRAIDGESAVAWYRDGPDNRAIVAAAVPLVVSGRVIGAVVLEQASDPILTLTNQALLRLVMFTVAVSIVAALGLLGYASFLSFRLRRLARAAETALGARGEINAALPGHAARDELGDLSRSFSDLLGRLREHTDYLRTLNAKLAHELRTPLAIVSTSLDNLEHEVREPAAAAYLERLREGATRLDSILVAMSAATRMEQAIAETVAQDFDLANVVRACGQAYADVYRDRAIVSSVPASAAACIVHGSGDLIAQLLDKLVENAVSFSPAGAPVQIGLEETATECVLAVTNTGPPLPAVQRHRLFDSLVCVRERGDGRPHLGLGLYIVALIAQFHGAQAQADNLEDGSGVVFRVRFPRQG